MVALHPVPSDSPTLDASIGDDDLVIALPPDATLDRTGADLLTALAAADAADAWYGDLVVAGRTRYRTAWSPTRLLTDGAAGAALAVRAGWLRRHDVRAADRDLPFRLCQGDADVVHVPIVVTHHERPPSAPQPAAVLDHLGRLGVEADLDGGGAVIPAAGSSTPAISIVVPTAGAPLPDGTPAVRRLLDRLGPLPDPVELVLVIGDEFRGDAASLTGPGRRIVRRPAGPFNFSSAVNLGVLGATRPLVLLLNDDTEPDGHDFLARMALHLGDPSVAAVGALLTYPDGTVQHAGMVFDDARPLHPFVGWDPADTVPHGGLTARDVVAVTGACMLLRRDDFLAVGGLSVGFPLSFNDVDLCVRLRRTGGRIVIEPAARLVHHETLTRAPAISAAEWDRWIDRWGEIVDPWYHPAHHRPDDPHALARNADHLPPRPDDPPVVVQPRRPVLVSRVHRGRPAHPHR